MENTLDVILTPALAVAADLTVTAPAVGELSEADLEVVVGGLTRAWVNLPEVGAPVMGSLIAYAPAEVSIESDRV
jgi:hypothetical protein